MEPANRLGRSGPSTRQSSWQVSFFRFRMQNSLISHESSGSLEMIFRFHLPNPSSYTQDSPAPRRPETPTAGQADGPSPSQATWHGPQIYLSPSQILQMNTPTMSSAPCNRHQCQSFLGSKKEGHPYSAKALQASQAHLHQRWRLAWENRRVKKEDAQQGAVMFRVHVTTNTSGCHRPAIPMAKNKQFPSNLEIEQHPSQNIDPESQLSISFPSTHASCDASCEAGLQSTHFPSTML